MRRCANVSTSPVPAAAERAFAGSYTRALLAHLNAVAGPQAVAQVLSTAGETRELSTLSTDSNWSTYAELRALLEASTRFLRPEQFVAAGQRMLEPDAFHTNLSIAPGDGPNWILERMPQAVTVSCSVLFAESQQVGETEWLITQGFTAGLEPFPEFCALQAGGHSLIPTIYGLPPADVEEEQCAARGAPACVFRLRWSPENVFTAKTKLLQARIRGLESWLSEFEQTVTRVLSSQDLSTVLEPTFASAGRAVHSAVCVLALREMAMPTSGQVFSSGVDTVEAHRIAREILVDDPDAPDEHPYLVAEVLSARRSYGRLAAVRASGHFQPEEARRLELYARLIAAALDSEFAIAQAQRQERGAHALLELSTALDRISTVEEVPEKMVRAVPGVMGLEKVAVVTPAADRSHWAVRATHGYPPEVDQLLRQQTFPIPDTLPTAAYIAGPDQLSPALQALAGTGGAMVVPFTVNDEWAGSMLAPIDAIKAAAGLGPDDEERLKGLAAQASTAIANAMMLGQIRHQALHDSLTGLPNRALILDRVEQMLIPTRQIGPRTPAVLFIDLDGFKEVNDTFGHAAGDQLLLTFARRLEQVVRVEDTIGRLGGDEFVVLLQNADAAHAQQLAERLLAAAREPFIIAESPVGAMSVTASIGIATGDRDEAGQLLRDADVALYDAKAAGKNRFVVFREQMQLKVHNRVLLQMEVENALRLGQFTLVFQPRQDFTTQRVIAVQAWPRWHHPERGTLDAQEFGPMLQERAVLRDLGRWMLQTACAQAADWQRKGFDLDLALAVSSEHLHDQGFLADVEQALQASGLGPARLILEISERALIGDPKIASQNLQSLHSRGFRLAVNGFGIGGFALTSLRDLPISILKIDKEFVRTMTESAESSALVRSMIQLGTALGLEAVADGVAQLDHSEQLIQAGCHYGQGPFIGPQMTADEIEARVRAARDAA